MKEEVFYSMIDAINVGTGFSEAWSLIYDHFLKLREFTGGLDLVYPRTSQVKGKFYVIIWEKDEYYTTLVDVSLAGVMHTKQFKDLHAVKTP